METTSSPPKNIFVHHLILTLDGFLNLHLNTGKQSMFFRKMKSKRLPHRLICHHYNKSFECALQTQSSALQNHATACEHEFHSSSLPQTSKRFASLRILPFWAISLPALVSQIVSQVNWWRASWFRYYQTRTASWHRSDCVSSTWTCSSRKRLHDTSLHLGSYRFR